MDIYLLCITAATIGFFHTLIGPDHYLPFIVIAKARSWKFRKTMMVTLLCGLGHVLSSIMLGMVGIFLGIVVSWLELIESYRGDIASWALISFGLIYCVWGIKKTYAGKKHTQHHFHLNGDGHEHAHADDHCHLHDVSEGEKNITPWVLFIIFVLGPCEPLIPILMYPAATQSVMGVLLVTAVFALATLGTMLSVVAMFHCGMRRIRLGMMKRHSHAIAGATIAASGLAIQFLGL